MTGKWTATIMPKIIIVRATLGRILIAVLSGEEIEPDSLGGLGSMSNQR